MSSIKKFKEIINGWKNVVFKNEEVEKLATKRARICAECIHNIDNKCNLCGCPLIAKLRSELSDCPAKKW